MLPTAAGRLLHEMKKAVAADIGRTDSVTLTALSNAMRIFADELDEEVDRRAELIAGVMEQCERADIDGTNDTGRRQ